MVFVVGWYGFCYTNSYAPHNGHKTYPPGMVKISELFKVESAFANYAIMGYYVMLYFQYLENPGVGYGLTDFVSSKNDM